MIHLDSGDLGYMFSISDKKVDWNSNASCEAALYPESFRDFVDQWVTAKA